MGLRHESGGLHFGAGSHRVLYSVEVLVGLILQSAKDGAQTLIHLSVEDIADSDNGQYWIECSATTTFRGNDPIANDRLLKVTRQALGLRTHID